MGGAGFGILAVAYPEDTAHPTDLLPEHNEVFGCRETDDQEPPLLVDTGSSGGDRGGLTSIRPRSAKTGPRRHWYGVSTAVELKPFRDHDYYAEANRAVCHASIALDERRTSDWAPD
jgi:hypothetical protein